MAEEIQQAIQIIRVAYDGIEIAMKIGSGSLGQMKKAVDFLIALLEYEKTIGKTNMRKLLLKGGDLQVLQFSSEDMKQVKKMAKKYGILYSIVPKTNNKDNMCEIIFHTEAIPRVNMMVQKLKDAKVVNFNEYLKNEKKNQIPFLKEHFHTEHMENQTELIKQIGEYICEEQDIHVEKIKNHFSITTEQMEKVLVKLKQMGVWQEVENDKPKIHMKKEDFITMMNEYQELLQRIHCISTMQRENMVDISISKKQIIEENDHAIKILIPHTKTNNDTYIWIEKENAIDIQKGQTILVFMDIEKDYKIYGKDNQILGTKKGNILYEDYYNKIEKEIKKCYGKTSMKKEIKNIRPKKR